MRADSKTKVDRSFSDKGMRPRRKGERERKKKEEEDRETLNRNRKTQIESRV